MTTNPNETAEALGYTEIRYFINDFGKNACWCIKEGVTIVPGITN